MNKPSGMHLLKGEKVVFYGRKAWLSEWLLLVLGVFTIWIFGIGLVFFLWAFLRIYSTEYVITTKRFYCKYKLIARETSETYLDKITDVHISQTVIGRLLNFGNIVVHTAGSNPKELIMRDVSNPKALSGKIRKIMKKTVVDAELKRRLERVEDEYFMGKITKQQYLQAKKNLMKRYGKAKTKRKRLKKS